MQFLAILAPATAQNPGKIGAAMSYKALSGTDSFYNGLAWGRKGGPCTVDP